MKAVSQQLTQIGHIGASATTTRYRMVWAIFPLSNLVIHPTHAASECRARHPALRRQ